MHLIWKTVLNGSRKISIISQREALDRIAYKDRQRRDYYNFYTGHEWGKNGKL